MLPKSRRIETRSFEEILKSGKVAHSPFFMLRYIRTQEGVPARFAAVAPVKIAKTSVARHAVRRRMYAAVSPYMDKVASGWQIIAFAKQPAAAAGMASVRQALQEIFVKSGLLR